MFNGCHLKEILLDENIHCIAGRVLTDSQTDIIFSSPADSVSVIIGKSCPFTVTNQQPNNNNTNSI